MCSWRESLTRGQVARQIVNLILLAVQEGYLLPRKAKDIKKANYFGTGHYLLDKSGEFVTCYAETIEHPTCFVLRSVIVAPEFRKNGLFQTIVSVAIEVARQRNPEKPVILTCHPNLAVKYAEFGFILQEKSDAPEEVRGGRTEEEWMSSDRVWMTRTA